MRLWMIKLNESPSKQAFMFLLLNWEIDQQQAENHKRIRKRRFMSRRQPNQEEEIHEQNRQPNQEPEIHDQKTL
jgi:pantothenate kinase